MFSGSQPGVILTPGGHLVVFGDVFGCHTREGNATSI